MYRLISCALLLLVVVGCAARPPRGVVDEPVAAAESTVDTPVSTSSVQPSARKPPTSSAPKSTTPPPQRPPAHPCRHTDLRFDRGPFRQIEFGGDGSLVTAGMDFQFTNTGATPCTLQGWLTIKVIGEATIKGCAISDPDPTCGQLIDTTSVKNVPTTRLPGNAATVTLAPGQQTAATVAWPHCPMRGYEIQVVVPGDATPIVAPAGQVPVCAGTVLKITPLGTTL
ncbi:DUF4232 domain-containing protein [Actinocrispum wychmicini]|uniref:Uncharacterized protein DUF4232 n=1 Tax=Actinocrispum wychmicini TaxID=1213861 RepID=A0A4R2JRC1_9PSEU|nr:DUF4232 domain-containing protein [Actinocrispum wychmicini]TCO59766.1 uncharacterized protein DUF4232 [Actinocrispum wychmicini]